jgi:uncharacterized protein YkwD
MTDPGDAVLRETNALRARHGLAPLAADDRLAAAALGHAIDLARRDYFAHETPEGRTLRHRTDAAGYPAQSAVGENIAYGHPTAAAVVAAWEASEGHRRNLLNPAFRAMGAAGPVEPTADGPGDVFRVWVQVFGSVATAAAPAPAPDRPPADPGDRARERERRRALRFWRRPFRFRAAPGGWP